MISLNINGRTSVPSSLAFGAAAILLMKVLIPIVDRGLSTLSETILNILALLLVAILSMDATLTISA